MEVEMEGIHSNIEYSRLSDGAHNPDHQNSIRRDSVTSVDTRRNSNVGFDRRYSSSGLDRRNSGVSLDRRFSNSSMDRRQSNAARSPDRKQRKTFSSQSLLEDADERDHLLDWKDMVDIFQVNQSLQKVSQYAFSKNKSDNLLPVLEITSRGKCLTRKFKLRELLSYVSIADELSHEDIKFTLQESTNLEEFLKEKIKTLKPEDNIQKDSPNQSSKENSSNKLYGNSLALRDLRRLDWFINLSEESAILVRENCLLFVIDPIRAVITASRVLIILSPFSNDINKVFASVQRSLLDWRSGAFGNDDHLPFELHCMEIFFTIIKSIYEKQISTSVQEANNFLKSLRSSVMIKSDVGEKIRHIKADLTKLQQWLTSTKVRLEDIIDDDDELAAMNLTILSLEANKNNPNKDHEVEVSLTNLEKSSKDIDKIEFILESNVFDFNKYMATVKYTMSSISEAEDLIALKLNTVENELLLWGVVFQILVCCVSFATYLAGAFGMNLNADMLAKIEFPLVFTVSFSLIFILFNIMWSYFVYSGIVPERIKYNPSHLKKINHSL